MTFTNKEGLGWLDHLERMVEERTAKELFLGHPGGARRRWRPRVRLLDSFEQDLRDLGLRERRIAQDY